METREHAELNRLKNFGSRFRELLSLENNPIVPHNTWSSLIDNWPKLDRLGEIFGLDASAQVVLACLAATSLDPRIGTLASIVHEDLSKQFLTVSLLDELGIEKAFDLLNPDHPLRAEGLILVGDEASVREVIAPLNIESRILNFLLGIQSVEKKLRSFCSPIAPNGVEFEDQIVRRESVGLICDANQLKRSLATNLAKGGKLALEVDARNLPLRVDELDLLGTLLSREQKLTDCRFILTNLSDKTIAPVERLLATSSCNFILLSPDVRLLESLESVEVFNIANQSPSFQFGRLAKNIDCIATWHDIVIPEHTIEKLRSVCNQVRYRDTVLNDWGFGSKLNRGKGTATLFHGESGTGKTMAAEVIANELQQELYRVDLSTVVDKYIGETEKNLGRIFEEAERGDCILLFDEADALFGKRSEVNEARDRYANIEVNYLLQRLEAFDGLTILATNLRRNLDQAFLRRFKFVIDFPFPDSRMREDIWRRSIPTTTPLDEIDFAYLAGVSATGGTIANAVINAAYASAAKGESISTRSLLDALRGEIEKLDQPVNEIDFRYTPPMGVVA